MGDTPISESRSVSTLRFGRVNRTMLLVHNERNPSAPDWSAWVEAYAQGALEFGVRALVVVSGGGGPNARQRTELMSTLIGRLERASAEEFRTAVCSDSVLARTITKAIGWLSGTPHLRSFGFGQRMEALEFLRVPEPERSEILRALSHFEGELRLRRANARR